jgi:D-proline reductase (dithiol) PrdB
LIDENDQNNRFTDEKSLRNQSMATFDELDFKFRTFMKLYRYRSYDSTPHTPLRLPVAKCRVALITTAGLHISGDAPFDKRIKGGDYSYREIPNSVDVQTLQIAHRSTAYDGSGVEADRNLAFPLDRFRELEAEGTVGTLNDRHFSFMGAITAPGRLIRRSAPEAAEHLKSDGVDLVFLTPV